MWMVRGGVEREKWKKEVNKMEWQFIVALVIAIPVILFPAALVWYMNFGGIVKALKETRVEKAVEATAKAK